MDQSLTPVTPPPRGLAALPLERRREIARLGGKASTGGFRAMSPEQLREVAAQGGRQAHINGHTHEWDEEEAREAGYISHPPRQAPVCRSRSGRIFQHQQEVS